MRIKTLKMLIELVELGSYSAVAEKLGLTQPAVSMQIKALEEHFNAELVQKHEGEVILTPAGKAVFYRAREIVNKWEKAEVEANNARNKLVGRINIGASSIPSEYVLPGVLVKYGQDFPEVKLVMEVGDSRDIIEKLEKQGVDLAVVGYKPSYAKFKVQAICEDSLNLILPENHYLKDKDQIFLEDLLSERMICREEGSGTLKAFIQGIITAGFDLKPFNIVAYLGSNEAVMTAVEAGLGFSFVSSLAAQKAVREGRVIQKRVVDFVVNRKFYLAYFRNRENEMLIQEFIKYI